MVTINPIAFTGRDTGYRSTMRERRIVHLALDVNDGETLCGKELAYVAAAGVVKISIPRAWTAMEKCGTCWRRRHEDGLDIRR